MSDKELIKQEIERLKHTSNSYDKSRFMLLLEIEDFIRSLPEEPKKQPKFKVGDTIKGPCNNIFQVKEVLDTQYLLHSENGDELNSIEIVDKYSCILKEPASEDLEEEIDSYLDLADLKTECIGITSAQDYFDDITKTAHHFAEWQKQKMMKNTVLETKVMMDCDGDGIETPYEEWLTLENTEIPSLPDNIGLKDGNKVKIIIIKED